MKYKVLIFPAGAENALEIYDALRYNVNVEVFGASGKKDFAEFIYDKNHYIEDDLYFRNCDFNDKLEQIIKKYKIDIIIPTHDDIVLYLTMNRNLFSAKILAGSYRTAEVCRSKKRTYDLFKKESFCPEVYSSKREINRYPVFSKPVIGAGSIGTVKIRNSEQLNDIDFITNVVCEYLPGEELTVDCFTSRSGKLMFIGPRERNRIQMGIAFRSSTIEIEDEVSFIAEKINSELEFFGAWYFQLKKDTNGKYKLLEVSCRQAGTMTLYRHLGINFPMLGIFELMGINTSFVKLKKQCVVERRLHSAFKYEIDYEKVYIDYDDTIVINEKICDVIIRFLYQCINNKKELILISRHEGDIESDLRNHKISPSMFDKIIHLTFSEEKTDYVKNDEKAIFIDNSFAERQKMHLYRGIETFDVDMIDLLLNE